MTDQRTSSTPASPLAPGSVLSSRYTIEATLGSGGMATVYRANDEQLGRTVALKLFRADLANAEDVSRQRDEIRTIASLDHPAIVTLFDAVAADEGEGGHAFLVMQYVDGSDLSTRLTRGPLDAAQVAALGADLASASAYVHERGVIHRDLKPANVLLPRMRVGGPTAMLSDFGIARIVDGARLTATGTVVGTAAYLSPEQALGSALTGASDVYSLGLVLIECLTGERCFPGSSLESAIARLSVDPYVPTAHGRQWTELLQAMTAREPGERPTAAESAEVLGSLALQSLDSTDDAAVDPGVDGSESDVDATAPMNDAEAGREPAGTLDPTRPYTRQETAATVRLEQPSEPAARPDGLEARDDPTAARAPRRRRAIITGIAVAALLVAGGSTWAMIAASQTPASPTVEYPTVDGDLGTHLERLEKSVEP